MQTKAEVEKADDNQRNDAPVFGRDFFYGTSKHEYEVISLASFLVFAAEVRANLPSSFIDSTDTKVTCLKQWDIFFINFFMVNNLDCRL